MNEIDPFLLIGTIFLLPTLMLLCLALYDYIRTRNFNKHGIVTYGEITGYRYGDPPGYRYNGLPIWDYLYINFKLENQEHSGVIYISLPFTNKKLKEKYEKGSKKKIKVLEQPNGRYEIKLLKENKENTSYWKTIILAVMTIISLSISVYAFCQEPSYKEDMTIKNLSNTVNYNKTLDNPYITKFATLNDETIESMNTKFGVQGKLENPNISQASYIWEIKAGMKIRGAINSDGKLRSLELDAQDDEFYDSNVKFASDISTLNGKPKITYEEVKAKCGGIDGSPIKISNGRAISYVWVNSEYKLTITIGSNGYVTFLILNPR